MILKASRILQAHNLKNLDEETSYTIRFYCYGSVGMTREWLLSQCPLSAKLDKGERYYHRTDEQPLQFAAWKPDFEKV